MKRSVDEVVCVGAASQDGARPRRWRSARASAFARDLANRSANDLSPERMAEVARELEADGCTVEVLEPEEMESSGWACCSASARGRRIRRA